MKSANENQRNVTPTCHPNPIQKSFLTRTNKANAKKKKINKSDLGINFVAPDGGWGWLVLIAAGFSNFSTFPVMQQFGLLFAERLKSIGLSASETTTIMNLNSCLTSCVGLINGPMFRRFSFRQVGIFAGILIAVSVFIISFSNSFFMYLLSFSILYGVGTGINTSANSLALNTYFKRKRRLATGLSWTITGMGPIIMPQIIAIILPLYGVQGTVMIYSALALNAVVCASFFQPVKWHVKKMHTNKEKILKRIKCDYCAVAKQKKHRIFSPKYLHNADNSYVAGYEIIDPGIPMLSHANDGWSLRKSQKKSRSLLYTKSPDQNANQGSSADFVKENSIQEENGNCRETKNINTDSEDPFPPLNITPSSSNPLSISAELLNAETETSTNLNETLKEASGEPQPISSKGSNLTITNLTDACVVCEEHRKKLFEIDPILHENISSHEEDKHLTLWHKIMIFFDLDLLKDLSYVNLMVGVTLGAFTEQNFSLLTPFILGEWELEKLQIATAMSLLAGMDITMRFFMPFLADKIGWENKTFFLVGILGMAFGRIVLTIYHSYTAILIIFCWIGIGKGLRTVFVALVIPTYVPLNRLPAASGLQLLFAGVFYFVMGPIVGLIRDKTNYVVTLHCLNIPTFFVAICWIWEKWYRMREKKRNSKQNVEKSPSR